MQCIIIQITLHEFFFFNLSAGEKRAGFQAKARTVVLRGQNASRPLLLIMNLKKLPHRGQVSDAWPEMLADDTVTLHTATQRCARLLVG